MTQPAQPGTMPTIPLWRVLLVLISVPGAYLALFVSFVLTLAVGAGLVIGVYYLCRRWLHHVPGAIVGPIGLGALFGLYAIVVGVYRSLRPETDRPAALILNMSDQPDLRQFIEGLCQELGCRTPDAVLLHSGPWCMVQQGKAVPLNGKVRGRVLTIGCPILGTHTVSQLKATLAHELAHFTGHDTLYSVCVYPAYVGLHAAISRMRRVCKLWVLPNWIPLGERPRVVPMSLHPPTAQDIRAGFMSLPLRLPLFVLKNYMSAFHRLDASICRLRETRADIIAAQSAGSDNYESSLRRTAREGRLFIFESPTRIADAVRENRPPANYYEVFREMVLSEGMELRRIERSEMRREADPYDTHPTLRDRVRSLPKIRVENTDSRLARTLLRDADALEQELTAFLIRSIIRQAEDLRARLPEQDSAGE